MYIPNFTDDYIDTLSVNINCTNNECYMIFLLFYIKWI